MVDVPNDRRCQLLHALLTLLKQGGIGAFSGLVERLCQLTRLLHTSKRLGMQGVARGSGHTADLLPHCMQDLSLLVEGHPLVP